MQQDQVQAYLQRKYFEHKERLESVHAAALDSPGMRDEILTTRAAAIAFQALALHGRSARLDNQTDISDPGMLDRTAQLIEQFRSMHWSEMEQHRIRAEIQRQFPGDDVTALDVTKARRAKLTAFAAACHAVARQYDIDLTSTNLLDQLVETLEAGGRQEQPVRSPVGAILDQGNWFGSEPLQPTQAGNLVPRTAANAPADAAEGDILAFAKERIAEEKLGEGGITDKTARQKLQVFQQFVEITGKAKFKELKQSDLWDYMNCLLRFPKHYNNDGKPDLSWQELLKAAENLPPQQVGLAPQTINRNLSYINKLFRQALAAGFEDLARIDASLLRKRRNQAANKDRPAYTQADLEKLFAHPIWTGCHSAARRHMPGNVIVWDGVYWCPLISAYTGMRREEIAGLRVDEVHLDAEVPHFVIAQNQNRRLKTLASTRMIPIPHQILGLGFDRFVKDTKRSGALDLFPELKPKENTSRLFGDSICYAFNKAIERTLGSKRVERDRNKTFHSFRHYVATTLGQSEGIQDKVIEDLLGHENTGTTNRVYKDATPLPILLKATNTLPDVTGAAAAALNRCTVQPARRKVQSRKRAVPARRAA